MASQKNIYVIGDTQVKPKVPNPLIPVAWDIIETRPDYVIHLGDHFDMPSLSQYDKGKVTFYSRRYVDDINAGNQAFAEFWDIITIGKEEYPEWKCKFIFLKGNHEDRIRKAMETASTEYQGLLDLHQPNYEGWDEVLPFLKPKKINGVHFVHYVSNDFTGRAISTASAALTRKGSSFVAGHKQVLDYAERTNLSGKRIMGLIMGACYFHNEDYKGEQGNSHFRGVAYLRNVCQGEWEMEVRNLKTLAERCK